MKEITKQALLYRKKGFSVIPVGEIVLLDEEGKEKKVSYPVPWTPFQKRIAEESEIIEWFEKTQYSNIGIITGTISGIVVIDVDSYKKGYDTEVVKSLNLPPTVCQKTGRGGMQYFYSFSGDIKNNTNIIKENSGIDVRGTGGMVIVPPSRTKTALGAFLPYSWVISPEESECASLPKELSDLLSKQDKKIRTFPELVNVNDGDRNKAMAAFVGKLARAIPSHRWDADIAPLMASVNKTYIPPLTNTDLKRIYESITAHELSRRNTEEKQKKEETNNYIPATSFKDFISYDFPEARYHLKPFFEKEAINMVSAPPNTWKSWMLFIFAAAIAEGKNVFDTFETEQSGVFIVNEEDSPRAIQDRFKLLGITKGDLPLYLRIAGGSKLKKEFVDNLIKEMKEKNANVVIFDSLRALHEADENDSTEMQKVMDILKSIAREGITVIFTHHHRKKNVFSKGDDAEASRGSSAINAAVSGHISFEEEERETGNFLIVRHLKSKSSAKLEPFELKIAVKENESVSFSYEGEFKSGERKVFLAKESIGAFLRTEHTWKTVKDFINLDIGSEKTVRQALRGLETDGVIISLSRKEAKAQGTTLDSEGKGNERIYFIGEGSEVRVSDTLSEDNF